MELREKVWEVEKKIRQQHPNWSQDKRLWMAKQVLGIVTVR